VVEHERVGGRRLVAQHAELRGEHGGRPPGPGELDGEPGGQVGHAGTGQHDVGACGDQAIGQGTGAVDGGELPVVRRRREVRRVGGGVGPPRVRVGPGPQVGDAAGAQSAQVVALVRGLEHPVADPLVEPVVVEPGGVAGRGPEGQVLAVGLGRGEGAVEATRVGAHRALRDGEGAVGRDLHEVLPRRDVVDDVLDGGHHAAARGQRAPDTLEQRRVQGHVAGAVGHRAVDQGDVRRVRLHEPDAPERRVHLGVAVVVGHGGPGQ